MHPPQLRRTAESRYFFLAQPRCSLYDHSVSNLEPPLPIRFLGFLVRAMFLTFDRQQVGRAYGARISAPLRTLLDGRIRQIWDRFNRLAEQILAGTYKPREYTPREPPKNPRPPRETPLRQKFGWLDELLPGEIAREHRSHLAGFLREPETVALIQAAPGPMARILRPLCWMLKLKPPEVLANHRRPAGTPPPPAKPYVKPPPPAPPIPGPANTLGLHPHQLAPMRPPPKTA
jgi:hypothetical protein